MTLQSVNGKLKTILIVIICHGSEARSLPQLLHCLTQAGNKKLVTV